MTSAKKSFKFDKNIRFKTITCSNDAVESHLTAFIENTKPKSWDIIYIVNLSGTLILIVIGYEN